MIVLSEKNRSLQQQQVRAAQRAEDLRKRLQEQSEIVQASIDEKSPDSQELSRLTSLANTYKAEVEQLTQEIQKITMDRGSLAEQAKSIKRLISESEFRDSYWVRRCQDCDNEFTYIHLRSDGVFGHRYGSIGKVRYTDENDKWSIQDRELLLNWNNGTSIGKYTISDDDVFRGKKSTKPDNASYSLERQAAATAQ